MRWAGGRQRGKAKTDELGGEEFLVLVPGAGPETLGQVLGRIRGAVGSTPIVVDGHELTVTVSIGGAVHEDASADHLMARADDAMYRSKRAGRDRVTVDDLDDDADDDPRGDGRGDEAPSPRADPEAHPADE